VETLQEGGQGMDGAHSTTQSAGRLELPTQVRGAFGPGAATEVGVALLGLRIDRLERLGPETDRAAAQRALEGLLDGWEGQDRWLRRCDGEVTWLVVPGLDVKEAQALARSLVEAGRRLCAGVGGRRRRLSLSCGLAHSRHRTHPCLATCIAVVEEGLRVAAAGGGRRAVHSEVYSAFARLDEEAAHEVEPATPAGPSREVELPRGPQPGSLPPAEPSPDAPARSAPAEPARDWAGWLSGSGAAPQAASAPLEPPAPAAPAPAPGPESELLHRRLTKLSVELENAEAEIARLRAALSHEQVGLASIYREVQGLSEDAPAAELKREMMERLFQANVELRELSQRLQRA
jgi:hypothetical protein